MSRPKITYLQYGGKTTLAKWIVSHFPPHRVYLVPLLYTGPFDPTLIDDYTYGATTVGAPRGHFKGREGIVITSLVEDFYMGGRRIAKSVSADYLDRRGALDLGEAA